MFKEKYKNEYEVITPSDRLVEDTKLKMYERLRDIEFGDIDPNEESHYLLELSKKRNPSKQLVKYVATAAVLVILCSSVFLLMKQKQSNITVTPTATASPTISPTASPINSIEDVPDYVPRKNGDNGYYIQSELRSCKTSNNESPVDINYLNGILTIDGAEFDVCKDMVTPVEEYFGSIDINSKDSYLELAFEDLGPISNNSKPKTDFYRYSNGTLVYLGTINCLLSDMNFNLDGTFTAKEPIYLLQENYTTYTYRLSSEKIEEGSAFILEEHDFYDASTDRFDDDGYQTLQLKCELPIYESVSKDSKQQVLKPQKIAFIMSDNKHWIQIEGLEDHSIGWFYFDNNTVTDLGLAAKDVFDNLNLNK